MLCYVNNMPLALKKNVGPDIKVEHKYIWREPDLEVVRFEGERTVEVLNTFTLVKSHAAKAALVVGFCVVWVDLHCIAERITSLTGGIHNALKNTVIITFLWSSVSN